MQKFSYIFLLMAKFGLFFVNISMFYSIFETFYFIWSRILNEVKRVTIVDHLVYARLYHKLYMAIYRKHIKEIKINLKYLGELCFGGRWTPKLTKGPCNSSNWAQDPMKVRKLSWRISSFSISKNALCWFWEKKLIFFNNTFI